MSSSSKNNFKKLLVYILNIDFSVNLVIKGGSVFSLLYTVLLRLYLMQLHCKCL